MNNLFEIVVLLEEKLVKLLHKFNDLQNVNRELMQQNKELDQRLLQQVKLVHDLEKKHESLRVANAIVGSKEDKHLTKLKINTLIRDIDKCIAQLSD